MTAPSNRLTPLTSSHCFLNLPHKYSNQQHGASQGADQQRQHRSYGRRENFSAEAAQAPDTPRHSFGCSVRSAWRTPAPQGKGFRHNRLLREDGCAHALASATADRLCVSDVMLSARRDSGPREGKHRQPIFLKNNENKTKQNARRSL